MRLALLIIFFAINQFSSCSDQGFIIDKFDAKLTIDGQKNEAIWQRVNAYKEFYAPWSEWQVEETEFRIFHDAKYLYFHFSVLDVSNSCHQIKSYATSVEFSDRVEIFFARDQEMSEYIGLEIDACGRMIQFKSQGNRNFVKDWKFSEFREEDYEVIQTEQGYQVEGRISKSALSSMDFLKNRKLLMGVFRANYLNEAGDGKVQWISWKDISLKNPDFHQIDGFKFVHLGD